MKYPILNKLYKSKIKISIYILITILLYFGCSAIMKFGEKKFLSTGLNGPETPQDAGIQYERPQIKSEDRILDSYLVRSTPDNQTQSSVLIFHGAGETISNWIFAQKLLYRHGISSLVFDYSGFGNSTHPGTISNLNTDAISAYAYFVSCFPNSKKYVLGFSLGNAPMLASMNNFKPPPSGVIVGSAFSSMKELGLYHNPSNFFKRLMIKLLPDSWNNIEAVKLNTSPLLVVHSDSDKSNPYEMGEKIFQAALEPKQFITLHNLKHNAPINDTTGEWWKPVIEFIKNDSLFKK